MLVLGRRQDAVLATFAPDVFTPSEICPEE